MVKKLQKGHVSPSIWGIESGVWLKPSLLNSQPEEIIPFHFLPLRQFILWVKNIASKFKMYEGMGKPYPLMHQHPPHPPTPPHTHTSHPFPWSTGQQQLFLDSWVFFWRFLKHTFLSVYSLSTLFIYKWLCPLLCLLRETWEPAYISAGQILGETVGLEMQWLWPPPVKRRPPGMG